MAEPFKIRTGDPAFDPRLPVSINGYLFMPADGQQQSPITRPPGKKTLVEVGRRNTVRARAIGVLRNPPASQAANAGGDHEVAAPTTEKAGTLPGSESGPGGYAEGGQN